MEQQKTAKDSIALIFLSIVALLGIVFFVIKLWFPNLLDFEKDNSEVLYKEEAYDDSDILKISVSSLKYKFDNAENFVLLDVQSLEEHIGASIPTAISMPLAEIERRHTELPKNKEIIAFDAGSHCQECSRAVEILMDYGFVDIKKLDGGISAWSNEGYPVISGNDVISKNINSDTLLDLVGADENIIIIDVRDKAEYDQGHIMGAIHIPFEGFANNIDHIAKNKKIIVYDALGNRSKIAIKQLVSKGYIEVSNLLNGYRDWQVNSYPIETK